MLKVKNSKQLALLVSISVNCILAVFAGYLWQQTGHSFLAKSSCKPTTTSIEIADKNLQEALIKLVPLSLSELIALLEDRTVIHDGYMKRDLALGLLIKTHYFNMPAALYGTLAPKQERKIVVGKDEITLYPGLSVEQYAQLVRYCKEERFPFTSEGLFIALHERKDDTQLQAAFMLTPEFLTAETLLAKEKVISRQEVIELLLSGTLVQFKNLQNPKVEEDFSRERRQKFLTSYLDCTSKPAAKLLLTLEPEYAISKLSDPQAMYVLSLLVSEPELLEKYALALLESTRKDEVWQFASALLLRQMQKSGKKQLPKLARKDILAHFGRLPKEKKVSVIKNAVALPKPKAAVQVTPKPTALVPYKVQKGDTLWRISQKFQVSADVIKKTNRLASDALQPGAVLYIPHMG